MQVFGRLRLTTAVCGTPSDVYRCTCRSQPTRQRHSPMQARTAAATSVVRPARPGSATSTAVPAHSNAQQSSSTAGPTAHRSRRRRPHHREGGRTNSAVAAQTPAGGQAGVPGGSSSAASQSESLCLIYILESNVCQHVSSVSCWLIEPA